MPYRDAQSRFPVCHNANGVGANAGEPLIARTPLALRLNVSLKAVVS